MLSWGLEKAECLSKMHSRGHQCLHSRVHIRGWLGFFLSHDLGPLSHNPVPTADMRAVHPSADLRDPDSDVAAREEGFRGERAGSVPEG